MKSQLFLKACKAIALYVGVALFPVAAMAETAAEYINEAEASIEKGEPQAAVIQLKNALILEPDHASARLLLGKTYLGLGDALAAEKELLHSRKLGMDRAEWLIPVGQSWMMLGRQRDLLEAVNIEAGDTPDLQVEILVLRGSASIDQGAYQQADKIFLQILDRVPGEPRALLGRATVAAKMGDNDAALELAQAVDPEYLQRDLLLGTIYYLQGESEQAEARLQTYLETVPGQLSAIKLLAATYIKRQQPEKAIALLEQGLEIRPKEKQLLVLMSAACFQSGDVSRGQDYLDQASGSISGASMFRESLAGSRQTPAATGLIQAEALLVLSHLQEKDFTTAIRDARDLAIRLPENPVPYQLEAAAWRGKNDRVKARKLFQDALKRDSAYMPALINLARLDLEEGKLSAARAQYHAILKLDQKNLSAMLGLYQLESVAARPAEARKWLERAYKSHPDDKVPGLLLAEHYLQAGLPDKALDVLGGLLKTYPGDPAILKLLALANINAKGYAAAVDVLTTLTEINPDNYQFEYLLGIALEGKGDSASARKHLKRSLELKANNPSALISLVNLEMHAGNYDDALVLVKELQTLQPAAATGYELEGDIQLALKADLKAASSYEVALDKAANDTLVRKLSQLYTRIGEEDKAEAVLQARLAEHPEDAATRLLLAESFHRSGQTQKAIDNYQMVVTADPKNATVLNNLAWLYQAQDLNKSIEYAEQAYRLAGERADVADTLGWLLIKKGENERGLQLIQEAVNNQPEMGELRYHLAVALYRNGNVADANSELQRLLASEKDFPSVDAARKLQKEIELQ